MAEPCAAGGLVGAGQQLDLGGLGDVLGIGLDVVRRERRRWRVSDDRARAAAATARRPRPPLRPRRARPGLGQVGGVGEAGGVADDDADAGAAVAAGGELLDLAVVEQGRRRALVLGEDLGEVAAGVQGRAEHAADHVFDRSPWSIRTRTSAARGVGWTDREGAYRTPVPVKPGLSAERRTDRRRRRHGGRVQSGRRARAGHAPGRRPVRGGDGQAVARRARSGRDHGRHAGAARPPRPHRRSATVSGPRPRSRRSTAAGSPSRCRSATSAAWSPPAG